MVGAVDLNYLIDCSVAFVELVGPVELADSVERLVFSALVELVGSAEGFEPLEFAALVVGLAVASDFAGCSEPFEFAAALVDFAVQAVASEFVVLVEFAELAVVSEFVGWFVQPELVGIY